jgi:hypothetical protein
VELRREGNPSDSQDLTAVGVGYARREQGKDGALIGGPRLQYPGSNWFKLVKSISKGIQTFMNNFKLMQILIDPKRTFLNSKNLK